MISVSMSASFSCTSWKPPIGRSNMMRVLQYSAAAWKQAIARADDAEGDAEARLRQAAERSLQAGHVGQQVRLGDVHVLEQQLARDRGAQAVLALLLGRAEKPFMPFSTRKPRISSLPVWSSLSLAHTTARSAMVPFVIHILAPLRTYPPPCFTARVIMPLGFEPKSGSVSPKQPITSPFAIFGSHCRRCSSEP